MRFEYPYKLYILGFIVFIAFSSFGFYTLFIMNDVPSEYSIYYMFLCLLISSWYYVWYKIYKRKSILLDNMAVTIIDGEHKTRYGDEDIYKIVEVKRRYFVKIQDEIHLVTNSGECECLTDEINSFENLRFHLKEMFGERYVIKNKLLSSRVSIQETL